MCKFFLHFPYFFCNFAPKIVIFMRKSLFFFLLIALVACSPKKPTVAELRAEKARLDSIDCLNQQRTIRYTDSLLSLQMPVVDEMLRTFVYEKNETYEDHGHYVHRLLKTSSNTSRCFLQAYVSDNRITSVRSYYYGARPINHTTLVLSAVGEEGVLFRTSGHLHSFDVEGVHETVTIEGDDALAVLRFIDGYGDGKIRIQLFADSETPKATYYLSDTEKQALRETFALGVQMNDIHLLEQQQRQATLKVDKYTRKYNK